MPALPPVRRPSVPKLLERIRSVWQENEVPDWHQQLFEAKYGGGEYGPEVLQRELQALESGNALVQRVVAAIKFREEVLVRLTLLRTGYDDAEFLTAGSLPRKHLFEQLEELRLSTFHCVEALSAWRRFLRRQVGTCIVWPYDGPTGVVDANCTAEQDYLVQIADEEVLREFETVVELSAERDPFLLFKSSGGAGWKEPGRLCAPAAGSRRPRLERARLLLMEDELSLSLRPKPLPPAEEQVPEATWNHLELPFEVVFSPPEGIEEEILEKLMDRSKKTGRVAPNLLALLKVWESSGDAVSETSAEVPAAPAGAIMKLPITIKRWRPKTR